MQPKITMEPTGPRNTSVVSERIPWRDDAAPIGPRPPQRRNPASILLGALRGDEYVVGAYRSGEER